MNWEKFDCRAPTVLFLCAVFLGYNAFQAGTTEPAGRYVSLVLLGLVAIQFAAQRGSSAWSIQPSRLVRWTIALLPLYVLFQLVPLPVRLLRLLSPVHAAVLESLAPINGRPGFASLSVSPSRTFQGLLLLCSYLIIFTLAIEITGRLGQKRWLAAGPLIVIGALEACLGLWQHFATEGHSMRWGTYANPNHYAGCLEMTLPFAAVYPIVVLYRARLRRTGSLSSAASACATWAVAACMLAGVVNSFSRMGFIATLCSLLVAALLIVQEPRFSNARSRRGRSLAAGMLGGVALSAFILLPPSGLLRRFADLGAGKFTGDGRTALWAEAVSVIRDYKVFGCGLYAYEMAVPPYKLAETIGIVSFAHNDYLQGTAELGGLGFLIVGLLAASIVRSAIRPVVNSFDPESAYFAVACAAAIVAILLHSLVDFNLYVPANASLLAWIAGISVGNRLSSVGFQQLSPERRSWTRQAHA